MSVASNLPVYLLEEYFKHPAIIIGSKDKYYSTIKPKINKIVTNSITVTELKRAIKDETNKYVAEKKAAIKKK
jgi:hypothetical protein